MNDENHPREQPIILQEETENKIEQTQTYMQVFLKRTGLREHFYKNHPQEQPIIVKKQKNITMQTQSFMQVFL